MASKRDIEVVTARKGKLIVPSGFNNYDVCLNPYVGCEFGCRYCYVRFQVKDPNKPWGEFVRRREHIHTKLAGELATHGGERLVLGTMTDPYQPEERKARLTRTALQIILNSPVPLNKVGIFTRSPIILDDIDLIKRLPRARVHFTVTPFARDVLKRIEPIAILAERRWRTIETLKEAGIRVHVSIAPCLPIVSDPFTEDFAARLAKIAPAEYFVDAMQPYSPSWIATEESMLDHELWSEVKAIVEDREGFQAWKDNFRDTWIEAWRKVDNQTTLPIWSDHVHKVWTNMRTGEEMDRRLYGDDL